MHWASLGCQLTPLYGERKNKTLLAAWLFTQSGALLFPTLIKRPLGSWGPMILYHEIICASSPELSILISFAPCHTYLVLVLDTEGCSFSPSQLLLDTRNHPPCILFRLHPHILSVSLTRAWKGNKTLSINLQAISRAPWQYVIKLDPRLTWPYSLIQEEFGDRARLQNKTVLDHKILFSHKGTTV